MIRAEAEILVRFAGMARVSQSGQAVIRGPDSEYRHPALDPGSRLRIPACAEMTENSPVRTSPPDFPSRMAKSTLLPATTIYELFSASSEPAPDPDPGISAAKSPSATTSPN